MHAGMFDTGGMARAGMDDAYLVGQHDIVFETLNKMKTHVKVNIVHAFTNDPFLAVLHTKMKKTKRANFDWNAFILTPYFI